MTISDLVHELMLGRVDKMEDVSDLDLVICYYKVYMVYSIKLDVGEV